MSPFSTCAETARKVGREQDVRRADEMPGRLGRELMSAAASSSDVAIGFSTSTCLPARSAALASEPCTVHAREHEHDVDVVALEHGLRARQPGVDAEPLPGRPALALVDVVDGRDARATGRRETLDHGHVGAVEDAAQPHNADPDRSLAHGRDASTAME